MEDCNLKSRSRDKIENQEIQTSQKQHVFIIGSKGIPAKYGGFETFVEKLTFYKKSPDIQYYVSCIMDSSEIVSSETNFIYNGAKCFNIKTLEIGSARAITYDLDSLKFFIAYAKKNNISSPIFYILACRIGPFICYYKKHIKKIGGLLIINPDGHEWKRDKWSFPIKKYWKISEKLMVMYADLLICDSKNIKKYIQDQYSKYKPKTIYIAYGSDTSRSKLLDDDKKVSCWYKDKEVRPKEYYLVVGRFVPENNYETMILEFMKSHTKKDFVLITNVEDNAYFDRLKVITGFVQDNRIKFVGSVYDQELLKKIRENSYGYLHGHEVGGTNPSLLEALSSTDLNLLLDVSFNREVGEDGALYWTKESMNLCELINRSEELSIKEILNLGSLAKKRIQDRYSWDYIVNRYEDVFLTNKKNFKKEWKRKKK